MSSLREEEARQGSLFLRLCPHTALSLSPLGLLHLLLDRQRLVKGLVQGMLSDTYTDSQPTQRRVLFETSTCTLGININERDELGIFLG
jgi:hypothetical protein